MINLTESAKEKINEILLDEGNNTNLRVFVQGGGCSGFNYGFTLDEHINEDDNVLEFKVDGYNKVKVLVDAMSMIYLEGAEVDYKQDLMGAQFVIKNPNASSTCGCGSSFAI